MAAFQAFVCGRISQVSPSSPGRSTAQETTLLAHPAFTRNWPWSENVSKLMAEIHEGEEREWRRFRPFVWVVTQDGAHSLLTAIGERQVKVLWFPGGFENLPASEQLAVVQHRVREHYQETGGKYVGFGRIHAYRFAYTADASMVLNTEGKVIEEDGGGFLLPEIWLELA